MIHDPVILQSTVSTSRRERRKLEVRNRILASAVELFDADGVGATTVAEICERADVAQKTFFNHFPARQALLREIAQEALGHLLEDIEAARKQPGSTRDRLLHFFSKVAENAETAGTMRRELLTEIIHAAHESGSESEQARLLHDAFGAIVRDGVAAGDVGHRHDEDTLTELLIGAFYVLMLNWANLENYPLRERALATARLLGDALTAA